MMEKVHFRITEEAHRELVRIKDGIGVPVSESVRRGIDREIEARRAELKRGPKLSKKGSQ